MLPANHINFLHKSGQVPWLRWLCVAMLFVPMLALAQPQINRVEWYLDTDPGYGNATPISLSPGADISNLSFSVNIVPLSEGVHIVGVRSRDANGSWSHDNKQLFVKPYGINNNSPVPAIGRVEWYVDNDPGYGNATPISISQGNDLAGLSFNVNITPLTEGVHIVGVRSRDVNGSWSHDNKFLFVKPYAINGNSAVPDITNVEWYMDTDPGYGKATAISITPASNLPNLSFTINMPPLTEGVHIAGVRSKDANGAWSHDNKWLFVKPYSATARPRPNITKIEWYLDTDPGYGAGNQVPVTASADLSGLSFSQNLNALSPGLHLVGVRSQDADGAWSTDNKWIFLKAYPGQASRQITQLEYYLDTDPGYGKGEQVALTAAGNIPAKEVIANISGLGAGKHYVFFRSKDNQQAWSLDYRDSFNVTTPVAAPTVNVNSVTKKFMCEKDSFNIGYDLTGIFNAANQFQVFVSNPTGDFASETQIGSITANTDGIIRCYLPPGLPTGTGYKFRIKSTNPAFVSNAATIALNFYDKPHFNNDTTVQVVCGSDIFKPNGVWASNGGFTLNWTNLNSNAADTGSYRVIAINNNGCSDTVKVTVTFEIARWTGAVSSDWHVADNWSNNKVPAETTHVIIESGKPNECIISNADAVAASIHVKPGATLKAINGKLVNVVADCNALPE